MRRLAAVLCLVLLPLQAAAFDRSHRALRIGVLCPVDASPRTPEFIARTALVRELRQRGFDVVEVEIDGDSFDARIAADYFIELQSGPTGRGHEWAGVQAAGSHGSVSFGVAATELGGEARIYEGAKLSLVASRDLTRNATVVPATIGLGGHSLFASFALPLIEELQIRRALRAIARDAATFLQQTLAGS